MTAFPEIQSPIAAKLFALLKSAGQDAWPLARLKLELNTSKSQIYKAIYELQDAGLIRIYEDDE